MSFCSPPGLSTRVWVDVIAHGASTLITGVASSLTSIALRSAEGLTLTVGLGLADGLGDADADPLALALGDGDADGLAVSSGVEQADRAISEATAVATKAPRSAREEKVT